MSTDNKHNNQYQKNDKKILEGYLSELKRGGANRVILLKDIARTADVQYQTMLCHYMNFSELESSNVEEAVKYLCSLTDECRKKGPDLESSPILIQKLVPKCLLCLSRQFFRRKSCI